MWIPEQSNMSQNFLAILAFAFNWILLSILMYLFTAQNCSDYDDGLSKYVQNVLAPFFPHILWGEHTHVFSLTIGLFLTVFPLTKWRPNDALYSDDGSYVFWAIFFGQLCQLQITLLQLQYKTHYKHTDRNKLNFKLFSNWAKF